MTILSVELFLKEARIIQFEGVRSLTESVWNCDGDPAKVRTDDLLTGALTNFQIQVAQALLLALNNILDVAEVLLQVVDVHVDGKKGVRWNDCFNF